VAAGQRGANALGVGTQKSNVDHVVRLVPRLTSSPGHKASDTSVHVALRPRAPVVRAAT
jgi:hypothetical protein